jgi:hypothetical protein
LLEETARTLDLVSTGGHEARFPGRRVFPLRFLLRHYPIRGQAHGERKVFKERRARFSAEERARGWHVQYDALKEGASFLREPSSLTPYDPWSIRLDLALRHRGVEALEQERAALREDLARRGEELASVRAQLADCRQELSSARDVVTRLDRELASSREDLKLLHHHTEVARQDLLQAQEALRQELRQELGGAGGAADRSPIPAGDDPVLAHLALDVLPARVHRQPVTRVIGFA